MEQTKKETKLLHKNSFKIVGTLESADVKTGVSKKGSSYASVNAIINSRVPVAGKDNEFETLTFDVEFFANELTKEGKTSQLFVTYTKLPELAGKKIEVTGSINESRFFSKRTNQMASSQRLSGRWVRAVPTTTVDEGTYELGGFVASSVREKMTKDGDVYRYDLVLGQANYDGSAMSQFVLNILPEQRDIYAGVSGYSIGDTVLLRGNLHHKTEVVTAEVKNEGGFGAPVTKTYTNTTRNFLISTGSAPLEGESAYPADVIQDLVKAYKAHDVEIAATSESAPVEEKSKVTNSQPAFDFTSLL